MKKVDMLKAAGAIVVSIGVGSIVGNVVKCTTPITTGPIKRLCILIGSFVLCNMVGDQAVDYTEKKVDDAIEQIKNMVDNGELS